MKGNNIKISTDGVKEFKEVFSNENQIIKDLLRKNYLDILRGKILDVGGGTADILSEVVPEENVTHLDILDFSSSPVPDKHARIQGDFLEINDIGTFDVLFMSHVHQFIDDDIEKLNEAISRMDAENIIIVEDTNDDFLGEIMRFSLSHFERANPEVKIDNFPSGYIRTKSVPFTTSVRCPDFYSLAKQCLYLMDLSDSEENIQKMKPFLESNLSESAFTINQEINLYKKS